MNLKRFFHLFPAPLYMTMPHSGVSLSDDGIHVIGFSEKHGKPVISHFSFEPLPPGIIAAGTIEKPNELIDILKKVQAKHKIEFVAGSIPDEKAYIFKTTVAKQDGINLSDIIAFKVQETVPISGPDAVFDFTVVSQSSQSVDVVVRVVHQKAVSIYLNVFQAAGMKPLLFKVHSQAVADAVLGPHDEDPRIVAHFEPTKTIFTIVHRRAVQFSSVIDVGTASFSSALEKAFSISSADAHLMMQGGGTEKKNHEDIFFAIANVMSIVRDQVVKLQEYWRTKEGEKDKMINMLMVSGMPASIDGFTHYLEQSTSLHTQAVNVWENIFSLDHQVPPIPFGEALDYAPTIGLALPKQLHF